MHAHERTLLAKLGFQDPDVRNPLHDLGCLYVGSPERAEALARLVYTVPVSCKAGDFEHCVKVVVPDEATLPEPEAGSVIARKLAVRRAFAEKIGYQKTEERMLTSKACELTEVATKPTYEYPIEKGRNQYKTTIGFVDVVIDAVAYGPVVFDGQHSKTESVPLGRIGVEVKIARESIGNCLRQIELYRSYFYDSYATWVLVSPWGISEDEAGMLASSSIRHVKLGPGFEEFCQRPQQAAISATL